MEAMGAGNTKGGEFISHLPKSWKSLTPFLPSLLFSLSLPSLPRPPPLSPSVSSSFYISWPQRSSSGREGHRGSWRKEGLNRKVERDVTSPLCQNLILGMVAVHRILKIHSFIHSP